MLEHGYGAVDLEHGYLNVCNSCGDFLARGDLPRLSLANGLWRGPRVPELCNLSWAERRLISLFRTSLTILHLQGSHNVQAGSLPSQRGVEQQRKLKGSFFCQYCFDRICLDLILGSCSRCSSEYTVCLELSARIEDDCCTFVSS